MRFTPARVQVLPSKLPHGSRIGRMAGADMGRQILDVHWAGDILRIGDTPMTFGSRTRLYHSLGLFVVLVTIFYVSPVRTSFDSRWAVATAMSFARGHWGDLTEYMPILEAEGLYAIEYPKGQPHTLFPI